MATFVIKALDKRRLWKNQTEDRKTKRSECNMMQDNGKEKHEERNPIDERYDELECSVKEPQQPHRSRKEMKQHKQRHTLKEALKEKQQCRMHTQKPR